MRLQNNSHYSKSPLSTNDSKLYTPSSNIITVLHTKVRNSYLEQVKVSMLSG